jgi:glycosyltransferase involved in cell wall biosynthesis
MAKRNVVSVIICFLNAERFIRDAIESVFAQTYSNWELLLIDDGSTDASSMFARQYAKQYPQKVTYLEHDKHKNLGLSASRNLGINKSHGEYIAFLDADDVWLPQKLREQIEIIHSHPEVSVVCGFAIYWHSWTGKPKDAKRDYVPKSPLEMDTVIKPPVLLRKQMLMNVAIPGGFLIKREMLKRIGGYEESFPDILEDQAFYIKVFVNEPVFLSRQVWFKYRQHPDSICNSIDKQKHCSTSLRFWESAKQYLINKGLNDKGILSNVEEHIRKRRLGMLN